MEYSSNDSSDRDKKMLDTFESYSDTEESEEKDPKKKKKRATREGEQSAEKTEEKKTGFFEAADEDEEAEQEGRSSLEQLFEQHDPEADEETEPSLPENLEELSDDEAQLIARQLIEARDADLKAELAETEPDSPEEAEVLANAMFIDKLAEKLAGESEVTDAELDEAADEAAAELEVDLEAEEAMPEEVAVEDDPEVSLTELAEEEVAESPVLPAAPISTPPTSTVPVSGRTATSSGGAHVGRFVSGGAAPAPSGPDIVKPTPDTLQQPSSSTIESRYRRGADMLVGGIIGYLIGRRRGRIKTEERLMPIQKSLEKKVKDLDAGIAVREEKIRKLTSEKVAREGEAARQAIADKVEAKAHAKFEARQAAKAEAQQVDHDRELMEIPVEMSQPERRPERLASVLLTKPEATPPAPEIAAPSVKEVVRDMPVVELLAVAATVEVGGQNAKQLYEQGRVSKEDLRAVVIERMSGSGKAERLLSEKLKPVHSSEMLERLPSQQDAGAAGGGQAGQRQVPYQHMQQSMTDQTKQRSDVSAMADAIIAQHTAENHKQPNNTATWIAVAGAAVGLIAVFFLL